MGQHKLVACHENNRRPGSSFIFPFPAAFFPHEEPILQATFADFDEWIFIAPIFAQAQILIHFEKQIHIFTTLLSIKLVCVSSLGLILH